MYRDSERQKLFTRRVAVLGAGKAVLLATLAGRMYYLQVIEADRYAMLADENRINFRLLAPPRGRIVDRQGAPLADNRQNYRILLIAENVPGGQVSETLDRLGQLVDLEPSDRKRILRDVKRNRSFVPVTIRDNMEWADITKIEVNTPDLPGIMIDVGQSRHYPDASAMSHVLGYVAAVSESEIGDDPLLELPGFRIGKAGVERVHDLALRGSGGTSQVEVNAFGRVIRELSRNDGQSGAELGLTIDKDIQLKTAELLKDESAACVVMDVHSGDVLALVSTPGFDPNAFNRGLSEAEWQGLIKNDKKPLVNKAVAGRYPPGSTFKMVVALAALERGVINPDNKVFCSGYVELGNARFHCWKRRGHGAMNLHSAIKESCDVYFYEIARRTGIDRIAAMSRRLGLGDVTGIDLPGESDGLIPDKAWKDAVLSEPWHAGETLIAGIGQGYILTTPLQLCVMTARLVNGGFAVLPRLTRAIEPRFEEAAVETDSPEDDSVSFADLGLRQSSVTAVLDAMNAVVNIPGGTAYRSRISEPGMAMGGKTGTAQVRRITKSEREQGVRKNKDLPWKFRDHALFVGYAPVESPKYAVAVVVEHGGSGSKAAAPIAKEILLETQRRMGTVPVSMAPKMKTSETGEG